ncbi:MAG: Isoleucine-tRNA ligase [Candidatus Magasanikbacteria bacterium GW2011_GWA2_46_17]|uniref:Isoleucine--tRNA ligase n=1 Tax=Candidatus Magasanikbacteria bacterium GW2011_GWA2_46_17 TaxID=1619042 RepID=A0A0G1NYW1_9BACT|nr:MAG: Isoleucine-tRNA ligase [Candidatus Magasanikbacteria bacterium GW2011_GWA2_46_17]
MTQTKEDNNQKNNPAEREEAIFKFWQDNKIFEKSLAKPAPKGEFVFYDGPPFATGLPHYGHILAGTIKDVIPRFKTMQGYHVPRRWGWDCHGLPVENLVEKELSLRSKKDIETYGLERFNAVAKKGVMRFADEWQKQIPRLGRFVDMENDYRTMDASYTESVWWAFKTLHAKGLIYKGFKSMHLCPRCETTLSNFEVSQGYKDITDISVYAKFEVVSEPGTFFLVWTTTPWTLPGNAALAVNPDAKYLKVKIGQSSYIIAESRIAALAERYEVIETLPGRRFVGESYKPLFDYYLGAKLPDMENAFLVYGAKFVATDEGTGIVHIAPAFGEDDYNLAKEKKLPFIQHVAPNGVFKKEVRDFAGLPVKPKGNPRETDQKIIENLSNRLLVYRTEKIAHSYPHCWRCDTPLLNYATSSWFVRVTELKNKLVAENEKIKWVPEAVGKYRFGNWLSEARDWAISRSRFWGAPIPVWRCEKCGEETVIGSIDDLKKRLPPRNRYFVMRHGEADNNVMNIISSESGNPHHLTERGVAQVKKAAQSLIGQGVEVILTSPFVRTEETTKLVADILKLPENSVITDQRIREGKFGVFNGRLVPEYHAFFKNNLERFEKAPTGGETYADIQKRMGEFIYDIDRRYYGKTILIITHDSPAWQLFSAANGMVPKEAIYFRGEDEFFIKNAEVKKLNFTPLPNDEGFRLDLHRPHIDRMTFSCQCGGETKRVSEVFDCWFESGSMPFASNHYPFENLNAFNPKPGLFRRPRGYPADFIAEGLDQTRGWFYSMLVLGVALFGRAPYRSVAVNGTVLAENGEKMSKRLQNYPDPMAVVEKYGADALRLYLLSSPVVRGEELRFSESAVLEVKRKVLDRLENVLAFYKLYEVENSKSETLNSKQIPNPKSQIPNQNHVLDNWIQARLNQLVGEVTTGLENYELDKAARPIADFVDDLSTWYLRRSRERIKADGEAGRAALQTLGFVLAELSKVMAPFTPFFAEYLYKETQNAKCKNQNDDLKFKNGESVHLEKWPKINEKLKAQNEKLIGETKEVRRIVSIALEARAKANIKVRQPLQKLKIKSEKLKARQELLELIKDEINVKEVLLDGKIQNEVELDIALTPELKREGELREAIRTIQELRKEKGLKPAELATLVTSSKIAATGLLQGFESEIKKTASLARIEHGVSVTGDFELK